MNPRPSPASARSLRVLAAVMMYCFAMTVFAGNALERIHERGTLTVGIDRAPPAYSAGKKFRTPENIDTVLAAQAAQQLRASLTTVENAAQNRVVPPKADIVLTAVGDNDPRYRAATIIPTGFSSGPMAIMRSDTDIRQWQQLKGRTVCVAQDGRYAGTLARQFAAVEKVYPSVTDSLLALRTGRCDAAVHDNMLMEELLKLPEWKKFSARLPVEHFTSLVFVVPAGEIALHKSLKKTIRHWEKTAFLHQQITTMARNIAFEVYLDQDVPDCH